jgi:hypothetical protein
MVKRAITRVVAPLLGTIVVGALTAGYVGAIPRTRSSDRVEEIVVEVRGDLKSVHFQPGFGTCAKVEPAFPFDVSSFERRYVRVVVSSEGYCLARDAEVVWHVVSSPKSARDAPEALRVTYQYRHTDGRGRLMCSYSRDLSCSIRDLPLTVVITGK